MSSHIYKFSDVTIDNKIIKIIVFFGSTSVSNEDKTRLDDLFKAEPTNPMFDGIFTPENIKDIKAESIPVLFVEDYIHLDDTVETIKKKLLKYADLKSSFDELYLYTRKYETMNSIATYQMLTKNEKVNLTLDKLKQFLFNINMDDSTSIDAISVKEVYTYDDILLLNLDNKQFPIDTAIGQLFNTNNLPIPYTVNPFNIMLEGQAEQGQAEQGQAIKEDMTTTTNKNILINSLPIDNNMIYICTAENVLAITKNKTYQENLIKLYFPFLFKQGITSEELLIKNKQLLMVNSEEMITNKIFERNISNVNLFYNLYYKRLSDIKYNERGTKEIEFIIHPSYSYNLPLDVVFKLIHATIDVPFIKYNPSNRQEKIYRLYTEKMATNGKKIPYLSKSDIFKLMKTIGMSKSKCVALYTKSNTSSAEIICEFRSNGDIIVKASFVKGLSILEINNEITTRINPIITVVKDFLIQSGYSMTMFTDLSAPYIEIVNMDFVTHVQIQKQITLENSIGCLSSIFNVINGDISKGATMRFKRVSNYNEMDSQEAFIIELLNQGSHSTEIIKELSSNFQLSEDAAKKKIVEFLSSADVQSTVQNKKLKIKNNPGFLTTMGKDTFDNVLTITVSGINDIRYLDTLYIYIDSILRLTQNPESSTVSTQEINTLCKKSKITKVNEEEDHIKDIVARVLPSELEKEEKEEEVASTFTFKLPEADEQEQEEGLTALDIMLFGMDEEQDEEEEEVLEGGAGTPESDPKEEEEEQLLKTDLTGKSLTNPNIFFDRLKSRDPSLFLTKEEGKFNSYSRICPSQYKRQPVILTNEEKEKIDKYHKGSYADKAVRYGSDPKKQFWYICPRYWSIRDQVSLTEEQAKSGKYGGIIPKDAKKIPPGGNVYEFTEDRFHNPDGKYLQHYPGFLKQDAHPDGQCIPCCFNSWDSGQQKARRAICMPDEKKPEATPQKEDESENIYIKGPEKFPLDKNRYGYLPLAIQKFIQTDNKKCQVSSSITNLKPNHPCFLRVGVEASKTQSFIACFALLFSSKTDPDFSIKKMKQKLIKVLTLDNFITLQNGDLVDIFYNKEKEQEHEKEDYAEKYKTSQLYKNKDENNEQAMYFLNKAIVSFINFIRYLEDDTVEIDHTYLWDLICKPNPQLFKDGLNLVILEVVNNDITDNIQLICPTNHYSSHLFDEKKETLILMKINSYYEPIYMIEYKKDKNKFSYLKQFTVNDSKVPSNIKQMLNVIKNTMGTKCLPFPSITNTTIYQFRKNIMLESVVEELKLKAYLVVAQVMNYNGKIIGVLARKNNSEVVGFIPCFPSASINEIAKTIWMDDRYGNDYRTTVDFLKKVFNETNGKIPCKPVIKMMEDELIVGILTQTNQFVILSEPAQDVEDDELKTVKDSNFIIADKMALTDEKIDTTRLEYIHKIRLETNFYNVFRNIIRFLLGEFKYRNIRSEIEKLITSPSLLYLDKLEKVIKLLKDDLMKNHVTFSHYQSKILSELGAITSCYTNTNTMECSTKKYCMTKDNEDNTCALVIPEKNLITGKNNEKLYFGRMADELIRYNRIRSFMFQPKAFLAFSSLKYNLKEDEIILLQSLLTQEYFENLVPLPMNKYIKYNTYDTAQPIKTQTYSNEVVIGMDLKKSMTELLASNEVQCNIPKTENNSSGSTANLFPEKTSKLVFSNEVELCSFDVILTLIKKYTQNDTLTKYHLKEILVEEYKSIPENYNNEVLQVLKIQGKVNIVKRISSGKVNLDAAIMSYDYYATNLDLWLLAIKYKIPLVLLSTSVFVENGLPLVVAYSEVSNTSYCFIVRNDNGLKENKVPGYSLMVAPNGGYTFNLDSLEDTFQMTVKENIKSDPLMDFIKTFSIEDANKRMEEQKKKSVEKLPTKIKKTAKLREVD